MNIFLSFSGCCTHYMSNIWKCFKNRNIQEKWRPSYGRVSFYYYN